MKFYTLLIALFLLVGVAEPTIAQAQTTVKIGPRFGVPFGDMSDLQATIFFGADGRIVTESLPVVLSPSFDFYLFDSPQGVDQSGFVVDLNAFYEFELESDVFVPYAGGGLGITRYSSSFSGSRFGGFGFGGSTTEIGLNLVGGARFVLDPVEPFAQLNAALSGDINRFAITAGVLFSF